MSKPNLWDVHTEFDSRLGRLGKVVVAGGAVRDTLANLRGAEIEPKDYDLFVLNTDWEQVAYSGNLAYQVRDLAPWEFMPGHNSEPFLVSSVLWRGVVVQLMTTPHKTVEELVDSFDWNVCRFGFNGTSFFRPGTMPYAGGMLELHRVTFPLSTLRRGFRYSERYQMHLEIGTLIDLCQQVAAHKEVSTGDEIKD